MASKEAYEANLDIRLKELRSGIDRAYELHKVVFMEAFVFATELHGDKLPQKILDVGCGLGFMSKSLAELNQKVVGIDISDPAISLAKIEHEGIDFYVDSPESFAKKMPALGIEPFDQAILNMVLHSVDDQQALDILKGVKRCLKPEGTVLILVPTNEWLVYKLIDYAQDQNMEKEEGIDWVRKMLLNKPVNVPVKINNGTYYPEPISIYRRDTDDYGRLLQKCGFGVKWNTYDSETEKLTDSRIIPYYNMIDYIANSALMQHDRILLMSFAL